LCLVKNQLMANFLPPKIHSLTKGRREAIIGQVTN